MQIREFITKLQNLPDDKKKIVLWTIVIILGLIMGYFWLNSAVKKLSAIGGAVSNINFPQIETPSTNETNNLLSSQTPAVETADWKTYKNDEYGFEIKIPPNWLVKGTSGDLKFTTQDLLNKQEQNKINCQQGKDCDPGELPYAVGYFKYVSRDGDKFTSEDLENGISRVEINGLEWSRYAPPAFLGDTHYRTIDDTKIGYDFMVYFPEDEQTLKQILSTFKFTN